MESEFTRTWYPPPPLLIQDRYHQAYKPQAISQINQINLSVQDVFQSINTHIKTRGDFFHVARIEFEEQLQSLRVAEMKKRPRTDYMEKVQRNINPRTRARCVDFLADTANRLGFTPGTLHLAINYLDRCLSGNGIQQEKQLRFLGLTCMMIASKYEEVRTSNVGIDVFVELTLRTFNGQDFIQMERSVLSYLKYDVAGPTTWTFLEMFIHAARGGKEAPLLSLECMARFIAELSLLSYSLLRFLPSLLAASSVFLARYILDPLKMPWNAILQHYTKYQPSDLQECVLALHCFCYKSDGSNMPMIRIKYSQQRYQYVAMKKPPQSIPREAFQNFSC